jgi:hypothetical protein
MGKQAGKLSDRGWAPRLIPTHNSKLMSQKILQVFGKDLSVTPM